jgi:hypothetical protein
MLPLYLENIIDLQQDNSALHLYMLPLYLENIIDLQQDNGALHLYINVKHYCLVVSQ